MRNWIFLLIFANIYFQSVGQDLVRGVGIGTDKPKASLHVVGNMAIREADKAQLKEDVDPVTGEVIPSDQQLFWNKSTGEIQVIDDEKFGFPFFVIDYELICFINTYDYPDYVAVYGHPNMSWDKYTDPNLRDKIKDFDTRIPDTYEVFLAFLYPTEYHNPTDDTRSNDPAFMGIRPVHFSYKETADSDDITIFENLDDEGEFGTYPKTKGGVVGGFNKQLVPIREAECFEKDGTWHIRINYNSARPPKQYQWPKKNIALTWQTRLLVIDKAYGRSIKMESEVNDTNINGEVVPAGSATNIID